MNCTSRFKVKVSSSAARSVGLVVLGGQHIVGLLRPDVLRQIFFLATNGIDSDSGPC